MCLDPSAETKAKAKSRKDDDSTSNKCSYFWLPFCHRRGTVPTSSASMTLRPSCMTVQRSFLRIETCMQQAKRKRSFLCCTAGRPMLLGHKNSPSKDMRPAGKRDLVKRAIIICNHPAFTLPCTIRANPESSYASPCENKYCKS